MEVCCTGRAIPRHVNDPSLLIIIIIIIIMFILSPKIPESSVDFTNDLRIQHTYCSNRKLKACKGIIT